MGMGGALAGLLSGVVVGIGSYAILNGIAATLVFILIAVTVLERTRRPGAPVPMMEPREVSEAAS